MKSVLPSPQQLKARLLLWPLLLLLSIFVVDITAEVLDFDLLTTSFEQEEDTELGRRTSKVSKASISPGQKNFPLMVLDDSSLEDHINPVTTLFHCITNFVRSGAKIAKELTTIS